MGISWDINLYIYNNYIYKWEWDIFSVIQWEKMALDKKKHELPSGKHTKTY